MGFIHGNTNSFEVYLTDYGLQTFYREGLKDNVLFFSCMDDDANYDQLDPTLYDPVNIFNNGLNTIPTIRVNENEIEKIINTITVTGSFKDVFVTGVTITGGTQEVYVTGTTVSGHTEQIYVTGVTTTGSTQLITITGTTITGGTQVITITGTTEETMASTPPSNSGGSQGVVGKINDKQWNNGGGRIYKPEYPINGDGVLDAWLLQPHLFVNGDFQWDRATRNTVDSRMNAAGIWSTTPVPNNEWIGFSRKIVNNLNVVKEVYVGMSADNKFRFRLNGKTLVENTGNIYGGPNFNFWNVYPVILLPGPNYIEMYAANTGAAAGFAAEVYDMTREQLVQSTNPQPYHPDTNPHGLNVLFSTGDMVGQNFDLGETIGYSCPIEGWFIDASGIGTPVCKKFTVTSTTNEIYVTGVTVTGYTNEVFVTGTTITGATQDVTVYTTVVTGTTVYLPVSGTTVTGHTEQVWSQDKVISGTTLSVVEGRSVNGQYRVFTQTNKRGAILDGVQYKKPLLKCNEETFKNYLAYEGDLQTTQDYSLLSYRKINGIKQFNVKGVNGLYLHFFEEGMSPDKRLYDVDSYPQSTNDLDFSYTNAKFEIKENKKIYSGTNDIRRLNRVVPYSNVIRNGYLILNESYDIEFDLHFTFFDEAFVNMTEKTLDVTAFIILGKNKVPVQFYTPTGSTSGTTIYYSDNTAVSSSIAEISTDHKKIIIKDVISGTVGTTDVAREVYVKGKIDGGLCKKSKELTIQLDYSGYGGINNLTVLDPNNSGNVIPVTINSPAFDFQIKNIQTNFIGVSVSDAKKNPSLFDTIYVLNKNNKSLKFQDIILKNFLIRNKHLSSEDKFLSTEIYKTERNGDFIEVTYQFLFKGKLVGNLLIKYPYSYYIKENVLLLPYQSFPIQGIYTVIDPGDLIKHYYGQSITEINKKTGTIDMNFVVSCLTKEGEQLNEDITFSVNLINGGFIKDLEVAAPEAPVCPTNGVLVGYVCEGCYKVAKYHDGNCGYYFGEPVYDPDYCGCTPPPPVETYAPLQISRNVESWTVEVQVYEVGTQGYQSFILPAFSGENTFTQPNVFVSGRVYSIYANIYTTNNMNLGSQPPLAILGNNQVLTSCESCGNVGITGVDSTTQLMNGGGLVQVG